jgi:hypothetical protein
MSKPPPLEKVFQAKVVKKLKTLPNTWFEKIADRSKNGIPDILMCVSGVFVALELKRSDKEKATPLQKHTLERITKAGGCTRVVNPENWDEVFEELQRWADPGAGWSEYKESMGT